MGACEHGYKVKCVKRIRERRGVEGQGLAEVIYQEGLEYWEIITFLVRIGFFVVFVCFGFFFFSSAIKTCGWDPRVAETNAVPWLQSRSQQPFLVAGNKLSVCLCYRNKLSGL